MHRSVRILAAGSAFGLVAAGLLAAPAIAATGAATTAATPAARAAASPAPRLPLSARQMLTDRQLHTAAAHATGSVTGLVQAPDGLPLAGICVTAYGAAGARLGVTSAAGRYFIPDLRLGGYQVRYQSCQHPSRYVQAWYGGAAQRASARRVEVTQTRVQPLAPVTLRTPAEASPARSVISTTSPAASAGSIATAFGLPSAGTGTFRSLTAAASAQVAARRGRISGVVTGDHKPLSGICVEAVSVYGAAYSVDRTGKTGHYRTGSLPAGTYEVAFFPGCGNNSNWLFQIYKSNVAPTPVHVHAGKTTTGISTALTLGGEISGTVTGTAATRLSGICVQPVSTSQSAAFSDVIFLGAVSAHGGYHVHSVPRGSYDVLFQPCTDSTAQYTSLWWHNAATYSSASAIAIKSGGQHVNGISAALPVGAVISGTVTSISSAAVNGICVTAQATKPSDEMTPSFSGFAATDASGHYTIEGLSAGTYQVDFAAGCPSNSNYVEQLSASFTVQLGGSYVQNVTLQPGVRLSGTVTSKATGKPLADACVAVWSDSFNYGGDEVRTHADGTFVVNNQVPPGTYYVAFSGGCGNKGSYGQVAYDSPSPYSPAPITASSYGQAVAGIDGALPPGATIGGTVTTSSGKRLTGICVLPVSAAGALAEAASVNGRYRIGNLEPGQYQMIFAPGCGNGKQNRAEQNLVGAYFGSQTNPPLVSARVGDTFGINGRLVLGGAISGKVRTGGGKALALGCVALTGVSGAAVADSSEDLEIGGTYNFYPLIPGTYTVTFVPDCFGGSYYDNQWYKDKPSAAGATRVRIRAGHTTTGVSSALVRGGSIAGYVTSGGSPVHDMCVFAQNVSQFLDSGAAVTNKAGHYIIRGLNSGRYELEIDPCSNGTQKFAGTLLPETVAVSAGARTGGVNLTAELGGTISGKVLGDTPVTPQAGICVAAFDADGLAANGYVTADGGGYTITSLPPGQYYVYFNDQVCAEAMTDLAPLWYPAAASQQTATTVSVPAGAVTALPDTTLPKDGAIAGTVSAAGHGPLPGACVIATSSAAGSQPVYSVSRGNGGYVLAGLAPGGYTVEFGSGCGATGYKPKWWKNRNSPFGTTLVTVTAGSTTAGISATLHK